MEPKLDWLRQFELDEAQLRKMVLTLPALLSYGAEPTWRRSSPILSGSRPSRSSFAIAF